jgi:hypothetical protein
MPMASSVGRFRRGASIPPAALRAGFPASPCRQDACTTRGATHSLKTAPGDSLPLGATRLARRANRSTCRRWVARGVCGRDATRQRDSRPCRRQERPRRGSSSVGIVGDGVWPSRLHIPHFEGGVS